MSLPTVGEIAPPFTLETDLGDNITLERFSGEWLALYFYPKDDTTACTSEAIDFSGLADKFAERGARIVGVSKDSIASHKRFKSKYNLTVTLASDPEGVAIEAYGAWVEKSMYGKKYMGIERSTFLIGPDKKIAHIWRKVKTSGHAQAVLEVLTRLQDS